MEDFDALFDRFRDFAFRLELLDEYRLDDEQESLHRYLEGQQSPPDSGTGEWFDFLRESAVAGKSIQRVRTYKGELTPYQHFELGWSLKYFAAAGEDVRMLDLNGSSVDPGSAEFWLFDDEVAAVLDWSDRGEILGVEIVRDVEVLRSLIDIRRRVLDEAEPLAEFVARTRTEID